MALFSIPGIGTAHTFREDEYAGSTNAGAKLMKGGANPSYPQEVVISCPNKDLRVQCPLGGPLQMGAAAEWEEMFGGGIGAIGGGIIGTANNMLQWMSGKTMQQPWMNRKIYKNTKPFSFTLPLNFVTPVGGDPTEWVAKPTMALISLLYPRIVYAKEKDGKIKEENGKKVQAGGSELGAALNSAAKGDGTSVASAALSTLNFYAIPGPSLRYDSNKEGLSNDDKGDFVNIMAGNMFNFGACYVTNVQVAYSESFNEMGMPLAAKVNFQATCADQVVCENNGDFIVNIPPQHAAGLTEFLDKANMTVDNAKKNLASLAKSVGSFWPGGGD